MTPEHVPSPLRSRPKPAVPSWLPATTAPGVGRKRDRQDRLVMSREFADLLSGGRIPPTHLPVVVPAEESHVSAEVQAHRCVRPLGHVQATSGRFLGEIVDICGRLGARAAYLSARGSRETALNQRPPEDVS